MRHGITKISVLAFSLVSFAHAASVGTVSVIEHLGVKDQTDGRMLKVGDSVSEGDTLVTTSGNGYVVLSFNDKQIVSLNGNTTFKVDAYKFDREKKDNIYARFSLIAGALRAVTGEIGKYNHNAVTVKTPTATIGLRGSDWMAALQNNSLYTGVNTGGISITNGVNTLLVNASQFSVTLPGSASTLIASSALPAGIFGSLPSSLTAGVSGLGGAGGGVGTTGSATAGGLGTASASIGTIATVGGVAAGVGIAAAVSAGSGGSVSTSGTTSTTGTTQ